jgi:hypothetical protein
VPAFPALSLGRCWGKPMQAVEATVSVFDQMTDDEQKMLLAALRRSGAISGQYSPLEAGRTGLPNRTER